MLTIADEGGRGGKPNADECDEVGVESEKNLIKRGFKVPKMCVKETN